MTKDIPPESRRDIPFVNSCSQQIYSGQPGAHGLFVRAPALIARQQPRAGTAVFYPRPAGASNAHISCVSMPSEHRAYSMKPSAARLSGTPRFQARMELELSAGESGRNTSSFPSRQGSEPVMTTATP